ncbi:MAG: LysM peptidoglycan-binding domain-containing protein [Bacillus sp. (in: firmicutes)]
MKSFIIKNSFVFIFLGLFLLFSAITMIKYSVEEQADYIEVEVGHGETLWSIAERYSNDHNHTAEIVLRIEKANNLNAGYLKAGDVIQVPYHEEAAAFLTMGK